MKLFRNRLFDNLIKLLTVLTLLALAFVILFIVRDALPVFDEVTLGDFLFKTRWMPIDFGNGSAFGIGNFILGTVFVSFVAMLIALFISIGAALFLSCAVGERARRLIYPVIDLLAGIPSVVYGFIGLSVLVKLFIKAGVHTGSCVLAAGILLAVMLLPYLVSSCSETMLKLNERYMGAAEAMGVDRWYAAATIILPAAWKNILLSMILAIGRAMGETMAVMMVMGNANLTPTLLGKGETIAALIALEMGTAVSGSTHYHALYAAGLVLMILLFAITVSINLIRRRLLSRGEVL